MREEAVIVTELDISVDTPDWDVLGDIEIFTRRAVDAAFTVIDNAPGGAVSISLLFADDEEIRALNAGWRQQDKPTNVLSFPASHPPGLPGPQLLGDIVLAFETCAREAEAEHKKLPDHVTHLIIHGVLHLMGYDHIDENEAEEMEKLETEALARLGIDDPYREIQI